MLEAHGVRFDAVDSEVNFGWGAGKSVSMEPYVTLRPGRFDIGRIGAFTYLGGGSTIVRNVVSIGRFCSIAPNLQVAHVEHPTDFLSAHPILQGRWGESFACVDEFRRDNFEALNESRNIYLRRYSDSATPATIGNDVWIGEGVFIRRGVNIGDGAIVGARSVVVKDVEPYQIVAGIPARPIRQRFSLEICNRLKALEWWRYGLEILRAIPYADVPKAIELMEARVRSGEVAPWEPSCATVNPDGSVELGVQR